MRVSLYALFGVGSRLWDSNIQKQSESLTD
jgi:hypothetical protein